MMSETGSAFSDELVESRLSEEFQSMMALKVWIRKGVARLCVCVCVCVCVCERERERVSAVRLTLLYLTLLLSFSAFPRRKLGQPVGSLARLQEESAAHDLSVNSQVGVPICCCCCFGWMAGEVSILRSFPLVGVAPDHARNSVSCVSRHSGAATRKKATCTWPIRLDLRRRPTRGSEKTWKTPTALPQTCVGRCGWMSCSFWGGGCVVECC